jgi:hypothetical protein
MTNVEEIVRNLQAGESVDVEFPCGDVVTFVPNMSFTRDTVVGVAIQGIYGVPDLYISKRNFRFISDLVNAI